MFNSSVLKDGFTHSNNFDIRGKLTGSDGTTVLEGSLKQKKPDEKALNAHSSKLGMAASFSGDSWTSRNSIKSTGKMRSVSTIDLGSFREGLEGIKNTVEVTIDRNGSKSNTKNTLEVEREGKLKSRFTFTRKGSFDLSATLKPWTDSDFQVGAELVGCAAEK